MTPDIRELGILSLKENHDDNREELLKTNLSFENGKLSISTLLVMDSIPKLKKRAIVLEDDQQKEGSSTDPAMEPFTTVPGGISIPVKGYPEVLAVHSFKHGQLETFCVQRGSTTMENFQIADEQIPWERHLYNSGNNGGNILTCTWEQKCSDCLGLRRTVFEKMEAACQELHKKGKKVDSAKSSCSKQELDIILSHRKQIILGKLESEGSQSVENMFMYQKLHQWPRHFYENDSNATLLCRASQLCDSCSIKRQCPLETVNWKLHKANKILGIAEQTNSSLSSGRNTENICKIMLQKKSSESLSAPATTPMPSRTTTHTALPTTTEATTLYLKPSPAEMKTTSTTVTSQSMDLPFASQNNVADHSFDLPFIRYTRDNKDDVNTLSYSYSSKPGPTSVVISQDEHHEYYYDGWKVKVVAKKTGDNSSNQSTRVQQQQQKNEEKCQPSHTAEVSQDQDILQQGQEFVAHDSQHEVYLQLQCAQQTQQQDKLHEEAKHLSTAKIEQPQIHQQLPENMASRKELVRREETKKEYTRKDKKQDIKHKQLKDIPKSRYSTCTLKSPEKFRRSYNTVKLYKENNELKSDENERIRQYPSTKNYKQQSKCNTKVNTPFVTDNKIRNSHEVPEQYRISATKMQKLHCKYKQEMKWKSKTKHTSTRKMNSQFYHFSSADVTPNVVLHDVFWRIRKIKKAVRRKKFCKINFCPQVLLSDVRKMVTDDINIKSNTFCAVRNTCGKSLTTLKNASGCLGVLMTDQDDHSSSFQHLNRGLPVTTKKQFKSAQIALHTTPMDTTTIALLQCDPPDNCHMSKNSRNKRIERQGLSLTNEKHSNSINKLLLTEKEQTNSNRGNANHKIDKTLIVPRINPTGEHMELDDKNIKTYNLDKDKKVNAVEEKFRLKIKRTNNKEQVKDKMCLKNVMKKVFVL